MDSYVMRRYPHTNLMYKVFIIDNQKMGQNSALVYLVEEIGFTKLEAYKYLNSL